MGRYCPSVCIVGGLWQNGATWRSQMLHDVSDGLGLLALICTTRHTKRLSRFGAVTDAVELTRAVDVYCNEKADKETYSSP